MLTNTQSSGHTYYQVEVQLLMDLFEKKTVKTSRGYTYTYYVSPVVSGHDKSLPTLLFQHGWPDHAQMWESITVGLRKLGVPHPMIIPDLLGYDGTSKPVETSAYKWDGMTQDLVDILDAEGVQKAISIGHDWGSALAQRFYQYHPERVAGIILLNVPYMLLTKDKYDLDAVNAITEKAFGYPFFAYWYLFTAPDGPKILKENVAKVYSALHARGTDSMKNFFCVRDAFRDYLLAPAGSEEVEVRPYAKDPKFRQAFIDRMERDGFEGPQNWYKATKENFQHECDSQLPDGRTNVTVPLLFIGCTEDAVCRPELMTSAKEAGQLPDLEESRMIESAHWVPYEKPDEVAEIMADYLKRRFLAKL